MKVLHLSFDIPDSYISDKTVAIRNLLQLRNDNDYFISMNRSSNVSVNSIIQESKNGISITKFGLPYGVGLKKTLNKFINEIEQNNDYISKVDIIHAHKLTYEGYIAYSLSLKYKTPYMVSIRFSDFKILNIRRDLKGLYKKILLDSKVIFCISPWMIESIKSLFGNDFYKKICEKIQVLPNIIDVSMVSFKEQHNNKYVCVFKISKKNLRRKNIFKVLDAIKKLQEQNIQIELDIIGYGNGVQILQKYIDYNGLKSINLLGKFENTKILKVLKNYKALILCSYPETFGLVYIEALVNGIPIIYSRDAGVDGFFKNYRIGEAVYHKSLEDITRAIMKIEKNHKDYKKNIKTMHNDCYLEIFSAENVTNRYEKILQNLML